MKNKILDNAGSSRNARTLLTGILLATICVTFGLDGWSDTTKPGTSSTVAEDQVGYHDSASGEIAGGTVNASVNAGGSARLDMGPDGMRGSMQAGLSTRADGEWDLGGIGDENFGADAELRAELEAVIGAKGEIGAYIDDKGITIGAEAEAGAYLSAGIEMGFDVRVFGVETNLKVRAEGSLGLHAGAKAQVHVGFDGKVEFKLGAGLVVAAGAQFDVSFGMDIVSLMNALGLGNDMDAFYDWVVAFQQDPEVMLGDLLGAVGDAVLHHLTWGVTGRSFDEQVDFGNRYSPASIGYYSSAGGLAGLASDPLVHGGAYSSPSPGQVAPHQHPDPVDQVIYQWPEPYQWPAPLSW